MFLLLDTDVVIDLRRQHPPALAWLSRTRSANYALPGLVVLELLNGAHNKPAARAIELFTSRFRVFWPTVADQERGRLAFADTKLARGTGILDMLIAQTAIGLGVPLVTFNAKHFAGVPGLTIEQPYER